MSSTTQNTILISTPVLLTGGTEIQTFNLVKTLTDAEYNVVVICYFEYDNAMVDYIASTGAEVILLKLLRTESFLNLLKILTTQFKKLNPDIIHVQYLSPGLIPIIAARIAGIKKILATVHQPGRTYGWKPRLMLRSGAFLCTLFLCVSKSAEKSWFGNSALFTEELFKKGRKHFTIYNAVDTGLIARNSHSDKIDKLRSSLNLNGKTVIGYVGRLRWEKGPHVLLTAFAKVSLDLPEAVLLMVGDGPDRKNLKKQAKNLGITQNIQWMGKIKHPDVFQLYGLMDVIAIPSLFEGFGLTAAEAMAAGTPVVASNVDGLTEVIKNKQYGTLIPADNPDKLAQAIIRTQSNPELRSILVKNSIKRVNMLFSISPFSNTILEAYRLLGVTNRAFRD